MVPFSIINTWHSMKPWYVRNKTLVTQVTKNEEKLWPVEVHTGMKHGLYIADMCKSLYDKIENCVGEVKNIKKNQWKL